MCGRVNDYCGCQTLRAGCISIALMCIIFSIVDCALGMVIFGVSVARHYRYGFMILGGCLVLASLMMIAFSVALLTGARRGNPVLVQTWFGFAVAFCVFLPIAMVILIIFTVVKKWFSKFPWILLILALSGAVEVYLVYSLIVVRSYILYLYDL